MSEEKVLELTEREVTELKHAMFYYAYCGHGTVGHNVLMLLAKMAIHTGIECEFTVTGCEIYLPDGVKVVGS